MTPAPARLLASSATLVCRPADPPHCATFRPRHPPSVPPLLAIATLFGAHQKPEQSPTARVSGSGMYSTDLVRMTVRIIESGAAYTEQGWRAVAGWRTEH